MKELTIKKLFEDEFQVKLEDLKLNEPIDVSNFGYEVLSCNSKSENVWSLITKIVKKDKTFAYTIDEFALEVSPFHLFYAKIKNSNPSWIEAISLSECDDVELYHSDKGWIDCRIRKTEKEIDILDIEVEGTNCWYSNGLLSHNTVYGDPTTTSGGMAIPFHSSVRIALSGGSKIENKDGEVIGINVIARTIKNKVSPPHKKVMFQIHFGKGIREHEELFDVLREAGTQEVDGKQMIVEGTGAWKTFKVTDLNTKTVLIEKKFTKSGFCEVLDDPLYKPYLDDLVEKVLVSHTTEGFAEPASEVDEDGVVTDV